MLVLASASPRRRELLTQAGFTFEVHPAPVSYTHLGHGGIILLGPDGRFGLAHNTPGMAWGLATPSGLQTGLSI